MNRITNKEVFDRIREKWTLGENLRKISDDRPSMRLGGLHRDTLEGQIEMKGRERARL